MTRYAEYVMWLGVWRASVVPFRDPWGSPTTLIGILCFGEHQTHQTEFIHNSLLCCSELRSHSGLIVTRLSSHFAALIAKRARKSLGSEAQRLDKQDRAGSIWSEQRQQTGEQQAAEEPTATQKMWHGWWRITSSKKGGRLIKANPHIHYLTAHN